MGLTKYKLGELLEYCDERNTENVYLLEDVKGISIQKKFIETKADMTGVSLKPYFLVKPDYFAYVPVTSRNGEKITIAHNVTDKIFIVSSSYIVFKVKKSHLLLSSFLFMFFNRLEFDRYTRFASWGSARETFDWSEMCDLEIELPDIAIQQKYVDMYQAMLANQQSYERGLEDLKQTIDIELEKIKYSAVKLPLSALLEVIDFRNENGKITNIQGIDINKTFISSTVKSSAVNIKNYKIVKKGQFAYSSMQTGRDECIRIALLEKDEPIIISPAYSVLQVKNEKVVPEFIMLWFMRKEMDRYGWFASDASIRASLELDSFFQIKIPIPELEIQQCIVDIYKSYIKRKEINERLKAQIKDICPVLIKGALEEARK